MGMTTNEVFDQYGNYKFPDYPSSLYIHDVVTTKGGTRMTIDDSVKQKLLDSLAEEPTMVLSTAYAYAKNYVEYGEDITKAWTTAVQQASILEKIKIKAKAEAYDSFKKEYENRLKADLKAILVELQLEIEEKFNDIPFSYNHHQRTEFYRDIDEVIQQKINSLKEDNDV